MGQAPFWDFLELAIAHALKKSDHKTIVAHYAAELLWALVSGEPIHSFICFLNWFSISLGAMPSGPLTVSQYQSSGTFGVFLSAIFQLSS